GANPGGGTLFGGAETVRVAGGTCLFDAASIDEPGMGYTLVASSGALTGVTSLPFNIYVPNGYTLEDFSSGNLSAYTAVGATKPTARVISYNSFGGPPGPFVLQDSPGNDSIYRDDATVHVQQGDEISVWLQFPDYGSGRAYFGFGASSSGALWLVA